MIVVNLFDNNFPDQPCSVANQTPQLMRYVRGQTHWDGITLFTDAMLFDPIVDDVQSRYKIGWLHEGRCLHPENYERSKVVRHKFDVILTNDPELLAFDPVAYRFCIRGGSWVPFQQWGMYPKSKNVAMILSEKAAPCEGYRMRQAIAQAGLPIDLFGPQYTPIGTDKSIAYRDCRFAVVVEPQRQAGYFTEHLLDTLAYGCVPLYWGCPNIPDFFTGGLLYFDSVADLAAQLAQLDAAVYECLCSALSDIQHRARDYAITEDWMIRNVLAPFVEAL